MTDQPTYDLLDDLLGKLRVDQHTILNQLKIKTPPASEVKKSTKEIIHDK